MKKIDVPFNSAECCGCGVCAFVCPKNCIKIKPGGKGFPISRCISSECVKCGACEKVCPITTNPHNKTATKAYAVWADNSIRRISSSGGAFLMLASYILENGGVVCGAEFSDDFRKVSHTVADNTLKLIPLLGSKYIQSDMQNLYKQLSSYQKGDKVLFVGCPCQVTAIENKFKNHFDLTTVSLVCKGVNSPWLWEKILAEYVPKGYTILDVQFRGKDEGWTHPHTYMCVGKGIVFKKIMLPVFDEIFRHYTRTSCTKCKFTSPDNRAGDLTIGDFWGVNQYDKSLNDKMGTSCVLLNTDNGATLFDKAIKPYAKLCKEVPVEIVYKHNPALFEPTKRNNTRYKYFFGHFKTDGVEKANRDAVLLARKEKLDKAGN